MNFKDYFSKQANEYALYRPHYPEALFEYLASTTSFHEIAWDCGTGNGQVALSLTAYYKQIFATDASEKQIAQAFQHERVHYCVAPAERTEIPANSIDLITVGQALHWFNLEKFYQEVRRVLNNSGAIAVWCYGRQVIPQATAELNQALQDYWKAVEPFWPPEIQLVEQKYQTIPFPFVEVTPRPFSATVEWTVDQLIGYFGTWSATQRFIQQHSIDPIAELSHRIVAAWGSSQESKLIEWPIYLRVGRLR